jgi:hypothetical protein
VPLVTFLTFQQEAKIAIKSVTASLTAEKNSNHQSSFKDNIFFFTD